MVGGWVVGWAIDATSVNGTVKSRQINVSWGWRSFEPVNQVNVLSVCGRNFVAILSRVTVTVC